MSPKLIKKSLIQLTSKAFAYPKPQFVINCVSLQVGARCLATGLHGAVHNVKINLKDISDQKYVEDQTKEAEKLATNADEMCAKILKTVTDHRK